LPNRWFSALAPGRTAVFDPGRLAELLFLPEAHIRHAYESRLSRGLGLLPDALAELLFLTQDALANSCFCTWAAHGHPNSGFSALAPGGLAELLFQPKAHIRHAYESRLSRGLGLLADALAELLFLTQDALANSCFCTWAGHGHPNRGFSALALGGLAELLFLPEAHIRHAYESRLSRGLGLLADALAELLFLAQDALANRCFCPWRNILQAYESRLSRGLGLLTDALAELLLWTLDALPELLFFDPGRLGELLFLPLGWRPASCRSEGSATVAWAPNLTSSRESGGGRDESVRRGAGSQWIVAARPLCHLQCPVAF